MVINGNQLLVNNKLNSISNQQNSGRGCPSLTTWGDVPNSLLDGFFPFFSFLERSRSSSQGLAGDEVDEPKDSQLSTLREDSVRRPLERQAFFETGDSQVSSMWLPAGVERRPSKNALRQAAALQVSKVRLSILKVVNSKAYTPLFFCD
jgi:hypothetical protein